MSSGRSMGFVCGLEPLGSAVLARVVRMLGPGVSRIDSVFVESNALCQAVGPALLGNLAAWRILRRARRHRHQLGERRLPRRTVMSRMLLDELAHQVRSF